MRRLFAVLLACFALSARAAVTTTNTVDNFTCNGATTAFPIDYSFIASTDLVVTRTLTSTGAVTTLVSGTDYTVTGSTLTTTGLSSPCATGNTLAITRNTPLTQPVALSTSSALSPKTLEKAYDRAMMAIQDEKTARSSADSTISSSFSLGVPNASLAQVTPTGGATPYTLADHLARVVWASNYPATGAGFSTASGVAVAAGKTLAITAPITITTAVGTIAAPLKFFDGGKLVLGAGGSATITGTLDAPLSQIFDTSGGGTLTFSAKTTRNAPQWWGAKCDGVTLDTLAVQSALNSVAGGTGGVVWFPAGTCVTGNLTVAVGSHGTRLIGAAMSAPS